MPLPDRPVSHASIESVWGQAVHDYTFAPLGTSVHGATGVTVGSTFAGLPMDTVDDDPGGWLGADLIEVPTGGEGLYLGAAFFVVTSATTGLTVVASYAINGS